MRKKELKLVVTFHTTADAMAMEKACKAEEVPGRLIPVPRVISAGKNNRTMQKMSLCDSQ